MTETRYKLSKCEYGEVTKLKLDLIKNTLILMKTGRWIYKSSDFNSSDIKMHIEFYLDGDIYIYDAIILPIDELSEGQIMSPFCKIINETLNEYLKETE